MKIIKNLSEAYSEKKEIIHMEELSDEMEHIVHEFAYAQSRARQFFNANVTDIPGTQRLVKTVSIVRNDAKICL